MSPLLRKSLITPGAEQLLEGTIPPSSHYIKSLFLMNQRKEELEARMVREGHRAHLPPLG